MGWYKDVTIEEVQKISSLLKQGFSPKERSVKTKSSPATISRIKNGRILSNPKQRKKRGATKKITKRTTRQIMMKIKKNPRTSI